MKPENSVVVGSKTSKPIFTIIVTIVCVLLAAFSVWAFLSYRDQKQTVDQQVADAVTIAKKEQADADAQTITDYENALVNVFVGPEDYGSVTFNYPRIWSIYVAKDASDGGDYEAYFYPKSVPMVSKTQQFALRMIIVDKSYDSVISDYASDVKKGDLTSSSITIDGVTGTRLDGTFSDDIRGVAVIFKIRDKTLTIRTDADTFKDQFESLINTITFDV